MTIQKKSMISFKALWVVVAMLVFSSSGLVQAQNWSYPGCADITMDDFSPTTMLSFGEFPDVDFEEPLKMALNKNAAGDIEIFFTERRGKLKLFNTTTFMIRSSCISKNV